MQCYNFLTGNEKSKMKSDSKSSSICSNPESEGNLIQFLLETNKSSLLNITLL